MLFELLNKNRTVALPRNTARAFSLHFNNPAVMLGKLWYEGNAMGAEPSLEISNASDLL